jgi:hypothetical protein
VLLAVLAHSDPEINRVVDVSVVVFAPEVVRCDAAGLDVKFHRCPLKEAWLGAGLPEAEVAALCRVAAEVDRGLFEAAGFRFHADTYRPGAEGCCFLHVCPGPAS